MRYGVGEVFELVATCGGLVKRGSLASPESALLDSVVAVSLLPGRLDSTASDELTIFGDRDITEC